MGGVAVISRGEEILQPSSSSSSSSTNKRLFVVAASEQATNPRMAACSTCLFAKCALPLPLRLPRRP